MPDWAWDWTLESKFEALCKEFGGEYSKPKMTILPGADLNKPLFCKFEENFDDFKAFTQWMNRQGLGEKKVINLVAKYGYDNYPEDYVNIEFQVFRLMAQDTLSKKLSMLKSKNMGDAQTINDTINEELGERFETVDWQEDLILTKNDEKELIEKMEKPYLQEFASVETMYDNSDDHWYAKAEVNIPIKDFSVYSSVLQDADDATKKLVDRAETRFNDKLYREINRIRGAHHG